MPRYSTIGKCDGKQIFDTRAEASQMVTRLKQVGRTRARSNNGADLVVYQCDACSGWHFGHDMRSKHVIRGKRRG